MNKYNIYTLTLALTLFTINIVDAQCISGDCINGNGTYKWESGATYTGEFRNGTRDGYGQYTFHNGDVYIGEWQNSERHGYGIYTYNDRSGLKEYSGEWKANQRTGIGIMYYDDASVQPRYGVWKENNFQHKYEDLGCLEGDCYQGYGIYVWNDGSRYEGNFKDGKRAGEGIYYYPKGAKYIGTQVNGKRHGWGAYYYTSGKKYEGEWVQEVREGKGAMYAEGRLVFKGTWAAGKPLKAATGVIATKDKTAPTISILSPKVVALRNGGTKVVVKDRDISVEGIVSDKGGVVQVRTSGSISQLTDIDKTTKRFIGEVTLSKGQNVFWVEATDKAGNKVKEEFQIVYEPKAGVTVTGPVTAKQPDINASEKRTALVIGNAEYVRVPALRNPKNDAIDIASKLQQFDFEVELLTDISEKEMEQAIRDFGIRLKNNGGVGLFYYAGHGLQLDGKNYLVPTDADIRKSGDIKYQAVQLNMLLDEMNFADNRLNIVILDACRDNPYPMSDNVVRGGKKMTGLAAPNAASGTYIAYSTAPGKAASDGSGEHGLYTEMLLRALENPNGMKLEDVFKEVRRHVMEASEELQIPWENSSIIGDFYFKY